MTSSRLTRWIAVAAALAIPISAVADSLMDKLLRIAGLSAAPGQMRSDDMDPGSIWIANLKRGTVTRLTTDTDYSSPIFSPSHGSVFALKGDTIVHIPLDGSSHAAIQTVPGIVKLVGFDSMNPNEIVILLTGNSSPLAVISLAHGNVTPLPFDPKLGDQRHILAKIRGQDRVHGTTSVYLKTERKQGLSRAIEWTDVYLQRGDGTPQNVSRCDGVSCTQPTLSPDGQLVAFVKAGG
jgi:hypothetical protein